MKPLLRGFGITGYRSFSNSFQYFGPLGKINFLAGANNAGKSNVLRFLATHYNQILESFLRKKDFQFAGLDAPRVGGPSPAGIGLFVPRADDLVQEIVKSRGGNLPTEQIPWISRTIISLCEALSPKAGEAGYWIDIVSDKGKLGSRAQWVEALAANDAPVPHREVGRFWAMVTKQTGGDFRNHWAPESLAWITRLFVDKVDVKVIPAFRQITAHAGAELDAGLAGQGLIDNLARLQHPPILNQREKGKFDAITKFVRRVTRCDDAQIEIPYDRDTIHVSLHGRTLPLESLGTGEPVQSSV